MRRVLVGGIEMSPGARVPGKKTFALFPSNRSHKVRRGDATGTLSMARPLERRLGGINISDDNNHDAADIHSRPRLSRGVEYSLQYLVQRFFHGSFFLHVDSC
jgi:hypothetical protein